MTIDLLYVRDIEVERVNDLPLEVHPRVLGWARDRWRVKMATPFAIEISEPRLAESKPLYSSENTLMNIDSALCGKRKEKTRLRNG